MDLFFLCFTEDVESMTGEIENGDLAVRDVADLLQPQFAIITGECSFLLPHVLSLHPTQSRKLPTFIVDLFPSLLFTPFLSFFLSSSPTRARATASVIFSVELVCFLVFYRFSLLFSRFVLPPMLLGQT